MNYNEFQWPLYNAALSNLYLLPDELHFMMNKILLVVLLCLSAAIISCNKEKDVTCMTPSNEMIQGSWKQDFPKEPAFEPPPEWEKIEFRNDSFFMRIRSSTDMITAKNCYQGTWFTYTKGVYNIDSMKIHFDGIITDSSYSTKVDTCHGIGKYQPEFGITLCGDLLTLKVILKSDTIPEERLKAFPEEKLKVKMYRY